MSKMTKSFLTIIFITLVTGSLLACGQRKSGKESEAVEVGVYDMYDLATYMEPVWKGRVVYNETVMFLGMDDKTTLLYEADEIISVRSYDLKTEYKQGIDYDYTDGELVLLEGTSIPHISREEYYTNDSAYSMLITKGNTEPGATGDYTYWGEGDTMTKWQVAVTYKHSQSWDGYQPECFADRYQDLVQKLKNGEDVTFVFYGDSITYGANSSFVIGVEPFAPSWSQMFTQHVAKQYGYTVKYVTNQFTTAPVPKEDSVYGTNGTIFYYNPSVGGWTVENGRNYLEEHVNTFVDEKGCDLFVVAFGMNNGGLSAQRFCAHTEKLIDSVKEHAPEMDVVMVSTMVPNPEATNGWYGNQELFEAEMLSLADKYNAAGTNCSVACMTSMSKTMLETKRFRDYTGNNINHPNDFCARIYAQVMKETVFGY